LTVRGLMGLPLYVQQVRVWRAPKSAEGQVYAVVTPHPEQESFDANVVDAKGNCYIQVIGYKTVAVPDNVEAEKLKTLQAALDQQPALV